MASRWNRSEASRARYNREQAKRAVLESGAPTRDEVRLTLDGVTHHCIVHLEPLRGPSGDVVGVTGAATDVTDQKRSLGAMAGFLNAEGISSMSIVGSNKGKYGRRRV